MVPNRSIQFRGPGSLPDRDQGLPSVNGAWAPVPIRVQPGASIQPVLQLQVEEPAAGQQRAESGAGYRVKSPRALAIVRR